MASPTVDIASSALPAFAVPRLLTDRLLSFVDTARITDVLAALPAFDVDEAAERIGAATGYRLDDPLRRRMVRVLCDLLGDCGYVVPNGSGRLCWNHAASHPWRPTPADERAIGRTFDGQMEFFDHCLRYVDRFLSGAPPLFDFDGGSVLAWERLLGNGEFAYARTVIGRLLLARAPAGVEVLVLCYGPGFDLAEIEHRRPDARVTALDFTNAFGDTAAARLRAPNAVRWMGAGAWQGFGSPLPFEAESFDAVVFSCADPYIPPASREAVYRDMFRVLRPGGVVGLLTHSYPDAARAEVKDEWVRRGIYCHDFLESVCQGWQGFYDAEETRQLFTRVGFRVEVVALNASVWRLQRPGTSSCA